MTPQLKLIYFHLPVRAELSRLVLTYAKIPFDDVRLTFPEWGQLKPNTPLGEMPLLEVDGTTYCQKKDETKKAEKTTKFLQETLPRKFGVLTSMIQGDYFMGNKVTFADIQLFDMFENPLGKFIPGFSAAPYSKLEGIANRVKANPEIAAYMAKHSSVMAMEELRTLLRDAEEAQRQTQRAVADGAAQVARLKDPVLLLLDVLRQAEAPETRRETLQVLRRLFAACAAHFYDAQAFLETSTEATRTKRGNVVLKALLDALTTLSSRDVVDEEAVRTLVEMVQELCMQSMNATDVVALFDFLRLGQPPARGWVLQMQKALVEMDTLPRAIFTMRGSNAGLIVPSEQQLFSKRGYSCSFGVHLDESASSVALYSFRGQNGQGVSAMLDGKSLVVKMFAAQGAVQQVEVPFSEHIEKMEKEWVHLCVVHAKKMVFKDKLTVFVDGKSVFNGNLVYPDPLMMIGGHNSIGIEPLADGLKGKLWSPTLFGVALSEAEVQRLHWLTHWKNDLNSVAAENSGLTDKSKFCFCYDARSCDLKQRTCYDVSGNDCHGSLGPGTSAYVTQSFVNALDSVGGCACFLLLLLDQIPEMADFHPTHEFGMDDISDLLAFVGAGLRFI
ncbi:unnamed protein product [Phytophthora lilii]|uniref:Unnamed protein product n=1 Tax=Phytophthora lilii TaxID=2077276 RepID=A0A9W6X9L3_9STRA|nr:unnamed protein product [Phytophthora lilii]